MKILLSTIFATMAFLVPCHSFVVSMEFGEKCKRSDAIIRGVVVNIVTVAGKVKDSGGHGDNVLEGDWRGPASVAVVRVVSVIKGDSQKIGSIVLIPCGYNFDESPCELTESKDYILFLEGMGRNYFHPLGPFCMHRVQNEFVGMSGFDWEGDFDPDNKNRETTPLKEFVKRIENTVNKVDGEQGAVANP